MIGEYSTGAEALVILLLCMVAGYILYEQNQVDSALTCFQECLSISQEQNRAATLNMLGCCCAVKVDVLSKRSN